MSNTNEFPTYRDLKKILDSAPDNVLDRPIAIFEADEEESTAIVEMIDQTDEDTWWSDGVYIGNISDIMREHPDDWEQVTSSSKLCPKGAISLHINLPE